MKERPLIVTTELIPKILDGTKTNTRRLNGLKEINEEPDSWEYQLLDNGKLACRQKLTYTGGFYYSNWVHIKCPYGQVGDRLWVRETFCYKYDPITAKMIDGEYWYRASNPDVEKIDGDGALEFRKDGVQASPWLPSIHMPRRASRIILEITGIRVERLQEITEEGAEAEGFKYSIEDLQSGCSYIETAREKFQYVWNSLNAKYPWESNPWVWVIEFKREMPEC